MLVGYYKETPDETKRSKPTKMLYTVIGSFGDALGLTRLPKISAYG